MYWMLFCCMQCATYNIPDIQHNNCLEEGFHCLSSQFSYFARMDYGAAFFVGIPSSLVRSLARSIALLLAAALVPIGRQLAQLYCGSNIKWKTAVRVNGGPQIVLVGTFVCYGLFMLLEYHLPPGNAQGLLQ